MKGRNRPVIRKSNLAIIAEDNDGLYYKNQMFPNTSISNLQVSKSKTDIKNSFYDDIARKYNLSRKNLGNHLWKYSIEILRSLAVFGEHEYIIDRIRIMNHGSF